MYGFVMSHAKICNVYQGKLCLLFVMLIQVAYH